MVRTSITSSHADRDDVATKLTWTVFKVMGLAPFAVGKSLVNVPSMVFATSRLGCAYNVSLVVVQLCVLILTVPDALDEIHRTKSAIGEGINRAVGVLGLATMFSIWLILGFRQTDTVRLLNELSSIDETTLRLDRIHRPQSRWSFFARLCALNIIMTVGLLSTSKWAFQTPALNYVVKAPPLIISAWLLNQYTFTVRMMEYRFGALNQTLLDCRVVSSVDSPHRIVVTRAYRSNRNTINIITTLRQARSNLNQIASELSAVYSIPTLLSIAFLCASLTGSVYHSLLPFIGFLPDYKAIWLVSSFFWISQRFAPIVFLGASVTNVVNEMKKTRDVVKELLTHFDINHDINIELQRFLLELLRQDVSFTACGLFSLDLTLVRSIIMVVMTYIVVLIQLQL